MIPSVDYTQLSEVFKSIGHPMRLRILCGLTGGECNVEKIVKRLGIPQSTASQHLGTMRRAGVITARRDGVRTCYSITDERIRKVIKLFCGG